MQVSDSITEAAGRVANRGDEPRDAEASRSLARLVAVGLAAVFVISVIHHPSEGNYFTICGFKNLTGLPCPGCGLTHSFCAFGKGHLLAAFEWNLLGPPLFLLFVAVWFRALCVLLDRPSFPRAFDAFAERHHLVRYAAYAFAVFGVVRILYLLIRRF